MNRVKGETMRTTGTGVRVRQVSTELPVDVHARLHRFAASQRRPASAILAEWLMPRIKAIREKDLLPAD